MVDEPDNTEQTAPVDGSDVGQRTGMPVPTKGKAALANTTEELPAVARPEDSLELDDFDDWRDDADDDREWSRRNDAKSRAKARRITTALAVVAALGVGFAGGVLFQKHQGSSSASASGTPNFAALRSAFAGAGGSAAGGSAGGAGRAGGFAGFGGGFPGAGNSVVGTVSAVANGTLYVSQGSSSALVKVVTGPSSTVKVSATGSVDQIQPGDTVIITGAKQSDGSYMAANITDSGATASSTGTGAATGAGAGG